MGEENKDHPGVIIRTPRGNIQAQAKMELEPGDSTLEFTTGGKSVGFQDQIRVKTTLGEPLTRREQRTLEIIARIKDRKAREKINGTKR